MLLVIQMITMMYNRKILRNIKILVSKKNKIISLMIRKKIIKMILIMKMMNIIYNNMNNNQKDNYNRKKIY